MKDVQKLAFVLVKPLYLHVKDGIRVHCNTVVFFDIFCQAYFVLVFDVQKFLLGFLITISEPDLQVLAGQVPAVPNMVLILAVAAGVEVVQKLAVVEVGADIGLVRLEVEQV